MGVNQLDRIERELAGMSGRLSRVEDMLAHIIGHQHETLKELLMDRQEIDRLIVDTKANTDATNAVANVVATYLKDNADLTQKLKDAIDRLGMDGTDEVRAAADAIEANNKSLLANVPKIAAAVTDGTDAAGGNSSPSV